MILGQFSGGPLGYDDELGWNPIKSVKSAAKAVGKGVATGAKAVGKGTVTVAKTTGKVASTGVRYTGKGVVAAGKGVATGAKAVGKAAKTVALTAIKPVTWLAALATRPVRNRVATLRNRRATKLAWDRRKTKTPNAAENAEAKTWTAQKLKGQGPHGHVLALFAGAEDDILLGGYEPYEGQLGVDPGTATVITASIPILMALVNRVIGSSDKSGEAPADPGADAKAAAEGGGAAPAEAGEVDMTAVQAAAEDAGQSVQEAAEAAATPPGSVRLPGVGAVKKNHLMIGGAVLGAVLLISLLKPSSK